MAPPKLPPGFRFHPTDVELVTYYLKRKVHGRAIEYDVIAEVDLYKCEPWDLPDKALIFSPDPEWYFFCAPDRKYANGSRTNRATDAGYWKATGKDRTVKTSSGTVGMKKTLVFHMGRAPHGERTDWVMHEYRLDNGGSGKAKSEAVQDAFVLCRVFKKNGIASNNMENSTTSDAEEEVAAIITQDAVVKEREAPLDIMPLMSVSVKKEEELNHSETTGTMDHKVGPERNQILEAPSTCLPQEASDIEVNLFYKMLLTDPAQSLDAFSAENGSSYQLQKLNFVLGMEDSIGLGKAQDAAFCLETPLLSEDINSLLDLSSHNSLEEADILDSLCWSTLSSQGSKQLTQHVGVSSTESRLFVQNSMFPKTVSVNMREISEVDDCMLKDAPSNLSDQKLFEECEAFGPNHLDGSEEVSEEELLEEMFQLVKQSCVQGQQSHLGETSFMPKDTGFEDSHYEVLEEPNVDDWMQSEAWNETSVCGSEATELTGPLENLLVEPLVSDPDATACSEEQLFSSSLLASTLPDSVQERGHVASSSTAPTGTEVQMLHLQDNVAKSSKHISWFSQLLDSVPVLPASAAELPQNYHKLQSEAKDVLMSISAQNYTSMLTKGWGNCLKSISFTCSDEILSGVWPSSALKRLQRQNSVLKNRNVSSASSTTGHGTYISCFRRQRNGCFSLMFFLGALSAVGWFLVLRILWRVASHMGSILV